MRLPERLGGGADPFFVLHAPIAAVRERQLGEERARVVAQALDGLGDLVPVAGRSSTPPAATKPLDVARELLDAVGADAEAEVLRGDVFELVRFVEDRAAAGGNHLAERVLADGRVGAQQVMVDDHDVGRPRRAGACA